MDDIGDTLGVVIGGTLGVYVARVGLANNGPALLDLLKKENGYLEFLVAIYALYLLHKFGPTSQITDQLIFAACIAVVLRAISSQGNLIGELEAFGNGKQSLTDTLKHIFGIS